jgi:2-polyprenyl-3-methyl-5-hydroxy-6-metoxy-1,4-benzoquinol methylase
MCICETVTLDSKRAGEFAEHMADILNHAGLALMISIGHRTGLFDTMVSNPRSTCSEIARAAWLNERYVREWLGAMVTGGIVKYDSATSIYWLPEAHAACLTRSATPNNMATVAQFIAVLGSVEDKIVHCFRNGGGVPYEAFPRFHAVMAEESDQTVAASVVDSILPLTGDTIGALSSGIDVLDIGCGRGHALLAMAEAFPNSRFCGYDFNAEAIDHARTQANQRHLTNVRFEMRDVAIIQDTEQFDLITAFDSIHDQAAPRTVLRVIRRALRPGGTFLMQDISSSSHVERNESTKMAPLMFTVSCMHCMTVSLAQGGEGLGAMWGEDKTRAYLSRAGFRSVVTNRLAHDIQNNWYVVRK